MSKPLTPEQKEIYKKKKREKWANLPREKKIAANIRRNQLRAEKRKSQIRQQTISIYDENNNVIGKVCIDCKREKSIQDFKTPGRNKCKECENGMHLKRRYGMTYDDKRHRYAEQNEKCAICTKKIGFKISFIDHNHETGEVRGLLCPTCNTYLGILDDGRDLTKLLWPFAYIAKSLPKISKESLIGIVTNYINSLSIK